jgi:DNA-binding transcriptional regulator PaaX
VGCNIAGINLGLCPVDDFVKKEMKAFHGTALFRVGKKRLGRSARGMTQIVHEPPEGWDNSWRIGLIMGKKTGLETSVREKNLPNCFKEFGNLGSFCKSVNEVFIDLFEILTSVGYNK